MAFLASRNSWTCCCGGRLQPQGCCSSLPVIDGLELLLAKMSGFLVATQRDGNYPNLLAGSHRTYKNPQSSRGLSFFGCSVSNYNVFSLNRTFLGALFGLQRHFPWDQPPNHRTRRGRDSSLSGTPSDLAVAELELQARRFIFEGETQLHVVLGKTHWATKTNPPWNLGHGGWGGEEGEGAQRKPVRIKGRIEAYLGSPRPPSLGVGHFTRDAKLVE